MPIFSGNTRTPHSWKRRPSVSPGKAELSNCSAPGVFDGQCGHRIFLTCRHHCCEMTANFALEGILDTIIRDDRSQGQIMSGPQPEQEVAARHAQHIVNQKPVFSPVE